MLKTRNFVLATCVALMCVPSVYGAFSQNYMDFSGTTVDYLAVTESNTGATALFGAPQISGDLLDFDPVGFVAESSGAAVITDGQLNFVVMSKNNSNPIDKLVFDESGDFTLSGLGAALAEATVGMTVKINVLQVNGVDNFMAGTLASMTFTPNASGVFQLPGDKGTAKGWTGHLVYDVSAIKKGATKVEVVLDNTLTATAANGGSARIAKKDFSGLTVTLPEPSSASLLVLLTVAGSGLARRRLQAA